MAAGYAGHFEPEGGILQRAALRKQGEGLEHHRHAAPPEGTQFASAELLQRSPFNLNDPQAGADQAIDHAQQGGLAGSGQPHHHKDLPGPDLQGDVLYSNPGFRGLKQFGWRRSWPAAETFPDLPEADRLIHASPTPADEMLGMLSSIFEC